VSICDRFRRSSDFILAAGRASGRDMAGFDNVLYHHVNVNDDKDAALADCGGGVAACGSRAA
jgi:hypothetical protein